MQKIDFKIKLKQNTTMTKFASRVVYEASRFLSNMQLSIEDGTVVDLKSILGVVSLGLSEGKQATITIIGSDEMEASEYLKDLLIEE